MEVILKSDVSGLGRFGEVVKVSDGYARNYLIPRGLAALATPGSVKQFNAEKASYQKKELERKEAAARLSSELTGLVLAFKRKVGEEEKIFGSVTVHDINDEIKARGFTGVEKKDIVLHEPIKKLGTYDVEIRLHTDITAAIKVEVAPE